jgi:hypothetical protein
MTAGDQASGGEDLRACVAHRNAQPGMPDHGNVVDVIADGADCGRVDPPKLRQIQDRSPFASVVAENLAHGSTVSQAALNKRLEAARDPLVGDRLKLEHIAP